MKKIYISILTGVCALTVFAQTATTDLGVVINGVTGRKFTDKTSGNSIFFPAVGFRGSSNGRLYDVGGSGNYWSSTQTEGGSNRSYGFSVRCVAENSAAVNEISADKLQIIIENGELKIETPITIGGSGAAQIFDVMGRAVKARLVAPLQNGTQTINVSALPAGIYIVKAGEKMAKFLKE